MANSMLVQNAGKKGSYTIQVPKDYAIAKRPIKEIIKDVVKSSKKPPLCLIQTESQE